MRNALTLLAVAAVASVACEKSPAAPMAQTSVDARVGDLLNFKLGLPIPVPTVNGTVSGHFAASLWDGSQWVSLGNPNEITVPLHVYAYIGTPISIHGEQRVPPGSYDRVRLVLQGVKAAITGGSGFNGITLSNDATFRLGGSDDYVEL